MMLALFGLLACVSEATREVDRFEHSCPATDYTDLDLDLGIGDAWVVGEDTDDLEIIVTLLGPEGRSSGDARAIDDFVAGLSFDGTLVSLETGLLGAHASYTVITEVIVPARMAAEVTDDSGQLDISGLAALQLDDGSGDVSIEDIRGALSLDDGSGSLWIEGVDGPVDIDDDSGDLRLSKVVGDVAVRDGSGSIELSEVVGDVQIEDDSGDISVRQVDGDVDIEDESGGIDVRHVSGVVTVSDGSGDIRVEDAGDVVILEDGSGSVSTQ